MTLTFKGKNVTVSGCTKVVGGAYITAVEGTIYQVIGYWLLANGNLCLNLLMQMEIHY